MKDLIKRLEAATGPDRQLDNAIEEAIDLPKPTNPDDLPGYPPHFTASIDAAITLVPEDSHEWREYSPVIWGGRRPAARINYRQRDAEAESGWAYGSLNDSEVRGATPALALCIAALKARSAS